MGIAALHLWVGLGVLYGMASKHPRRGSYEDCQQNKAADDTSTEDSADCRGWTWVQSWYFAITSISTGGLQGIPADSNGWHFVFVGTYVCGVGGKGSGRGGASTANYGP